MTFQYKKSINLHVNSYYCRATWINELQDALDYKLHKDFATSTAQYISITLQDKGIDCEGENTAPPS